MALLLLLPACPAPHRTPVPDDGDDRGADVDPDCSGTLELMSEAAGFVPGGLYTLTAGGLEGATYGWEVSVGSLSSAEGAEVTWTVPAELAAWSAEEAEITLRATEAGCADQQQTQTAEVDWPETSRVVVVYNPDVDGSQTVAEYYADFRGIDAICAAPTSDATTLYVAEIDPFLDTVQACIDAVGPHVQYVVPVYGVPYKAEGRIYDLYYRTTLVTVSVDALLVYGAAAKAFTQPTENQVYRRGDSDDQDYVPYKAFGLIRENLSADYYLVTRIDGESATAAMDLVDRTALAEQTELSGIVYVDGEYGDTPPATDVYGSYEWGEWNMWGTRYVFEDFGLYEVVWDGNTEEFGEAAPAPMECPDALYYAGWYWVHNYHDVFTWAPGAIGGHLDSFSASDLRGTSWSGEALKRGITATFGAVNEPYVTGMPEYDQFYLYLTQGANYGEAAYESTTVGAWMMVWVGDPLYRPYPG